MSVPTVQGKVHDSTNSYKILKIKENNKKRKKNEKLKRLLFKEKQAKNKVLVSQRHLTGRNSLMIRKIKERNRKQMSL